MPYIFSPTIDPENYLDISDPPPFGWKTIDTSDYRKALFSSSALMEECAEWQRRELIRRQHVNQMNPFQGALF